jgi:DNA topoisomerase-3
MWEMLAIYEIYSSEATATLVSSFSSLKDVTSSNTVLVEFSCQNCEETYSLPQNGTIKLYKELKCPLDNFELVLFSLGNTATAQGKSYPLCPYCYNHPPTFASKIEDMEDIMDVVASHLDKKKDAAREANDGEAADNTSKNAPNSSSASAVAAAPQILDEMERDDDEGTLHMGCDSCMHPTCKHGAILNAMCECPGANAQTSKPCRGMLILDVNSKPNWKLSCNKCNTLLRFNADIHSITPHARQQCDECGLRIATFEFTKGKSPLPNSETTLKACIMCNDLLNSLTEIIVGRSMNLKVARQIRYKRGAGGRGGRGRGRGHRSRGKVEKGSKHDPRMTFDGF